MLKLASPWAPEKALCIVLAGLLGLCCGCPRSQPSQTTPERPSGNKPIPQQQELKLEPPAQNEQEPMASQPPVGQPVQTKTPEVPREIPKVLMAEVDRAKCKLFVGDAIPAVMLLDSTDKTVSLSEFMGSRGTVLAFFSAGDTARQRLTASNLLSDLQSDIHARYADAGIRVVAIHVGPRSEALEQVLKESGAQFPVLIDEKGEVFASFLSDKPPAVYLVDANGQIAWLDVEYSRSARENLRQGVRVLAGR